MEDSKPVFGLKHFLGPVQGPAKSGRRKIVVSRKVDFFTLDQNFSLKMKLRAQFWAANT